LEESCVQLFLVLQLISCRGPPEWQTTGPRSSRASITPPTHAIDAQDVLVSSPPKLVRDWSSSTMPTPSKSDTLTEQHRFICMSTIFDERFSYQQPAIQTSFDTMAYPVTYPTSTSSNYQVSRPFQIYLLNHSIMLFSWKAVSMVTNYTQWRAMLTPR
jgi:hypothetical protein